MHDQAILEGLRAIIVEDHVTRSKALAALREAEGDSDAYTHACHTYTAQLKNVSTEAETHGLIGLREVIEAIRCNLTELHVQDAEKKVEVCDHLEKWPELLLAHLQSPREAGLREEILAYLADARLISPLDAAGIERLTRLLMPNQHDSETAQDTEILGVLCSEIVDVENELSKAIEVFGSVESDDPVLAEVIEQYEAIVERLWSTCGILGLVGLQEVCTFISNNLLGFATQSKSVRESVGAQFKEWPKVVLDYLQNPSDDATCKALIRYLQDGQWVSPLSADAAKDLLERLVERPTLMAEGLDVEAQTYPEDVSLEIPDDLNQELLDAFLQEAPLHAVDLSGSLQKLFDNTAQTEDIKLAQRIAHTLKGSAHLTGIRGVATLTHHIEDILEFLVVNDTRAPRALAETLVEAGDCLEAMVDGVMESSAAPTNALAVLRNVIAWAKKIDSGDLNADSDVTTSDGADEVPAVSRHNPLDAGDSDKESETTPTRKVRTEEVLRVPTRTIDELLGLLAELSMSLNQLQDRYGRTAEHVRTMREQGNLLQDRTFDLEDLVDVRGFGVARDRLKRTGTTDEPFDPLELNQYNELHSTTQGVIEAASDSRELGITIQEDLALLEELLVQQQRLNKSLQHAVLSTRMVPVINISRRLQRSVRQACRAANKSVHMEITGEDILVDGEVLQKLADPLMHILRNAVDHGIELPDERRHRGKPETGLISLNFAREGNTVIVRCEDDGSGLDYQKIREVAVEREIIESDADLADPEIARLVFTPGFSTHAVATQTSGRGVGLDVVYTTVTGMKGSVEIGSKESGGCEIILRLPVSLLTAHVLLVEAQKQLFAIPTTVVDQVLASGGGEEVETEDGPAIRVGEVLYPASSLAAILNIAPPKDGAKDYAAKPFLLVRLEHGLTAVVVDNVVDGRDLVIKDMGHYVKAIPGIQGASVLGDGSIVPVLDVPDLLRTPIKAIVSEVALELDTEQSNDAAPRVLIVDDSLSARRSLSQLAQDAGYETLVARDGLEAIEIMQETHPDVLLVDLEMPRMNGLELTYHVRTSDEMKHVPVIVVTSRSTDKHRTQATIAGASAYVTKPFDEGELLDLIQQHGVKK